MGRPEEIKEGSWRWPQILPGGDKVLFTGSAGVSGVANDNANLEVLDLRSGQTKLVQRGGYFGRYVPSGHLLYIHSGTLLGVPFDLSRLEARGAPTPIFDNLADYGYEVQRPCVRYPARRQPDPIPTF